MWPSFLLNKYFVILSLAESNVILSRAKDLKILHCVQNDIKTVALAGTY